MSLSDRLWGTSFDLLKFAGTLYVTRLLYARHVWNLKNRIWICIWGVLVAHRGPYPGRRGTNISTHGADFCSRLDFTTFCKQIGTLGMGCRWEDYLVLVNVFLQLLKYDDSRWMNGGSRETQEIGVLADSLLHTIELGSSSPALCCTKNRQTLVLRIAGYQSSSLGVQPLGFPVVVRGMHLSLRVLVRVTELILCEWEDITGMIFMLQPNNG